MKKTIISLLCFMLTACMALGSCGGKENNESSKEDSKAVHSSEESYASASTEDSKAEESQSSDVSFEDSSVEISEETADVSAEESVEESVEVATGKELKFKAKYVKTGYDSSKTSPYAVVIDSSAELTSYYLTNKSVCGLSSDYKKAVMDYDVEFFESKTLIMVACDETANHTVNKAVLIDFAGNKWLNLEIKRGFDAEEETGWHIIIELDKECLEAKNNIAINMVG